MSIKERLLRAVGLIIILRDELEELDQHHSWLEIANKYLDNLTSYEDESNEQYEMIYLHIHKCINTEGTPSDLINELIFILEKDMRISKLTTKIAKELYSETLAIKNNADIKKIKILDSKINIECIV